MPVAKLRGSDRTSLMKPDEGTDFLNRFLRQATGKEPFLSFSRNGDGPVQLMQLLNTLEQPDIPGWPLLTPVKVQMQKCGKCTREYCSSINYRRHLRFHHRLKKFDKDLLKYRELLGAFWDRISEDEAKEILSFKDVTLGDVPGSSILKSLAVVIQSPGYYPLPQYCWRAGSSLLDIIQTTRFPLSSMELFSILDDASEKTFLSGTAFSVQNYIFNGDAGKIGLEIKNLVACTSFLLEQKLVKAWLAEKDAEALRCQQLLMEEEETTQRRQAELLENRRQKKLRQKEQKAKEQNQGEKANVWETLDDAAEAATVAEQPCGLTTSDHDILAIRTLPDHVALSLEPSGFQNMEEDMDLEAQTILISEDDMECDHNLVEHCTAERDGCRDAVVAHWHMPQKSQSNHPSNGSHVNSNSQALDTSTTPNHLNHHNSKPSPVVNGGRKWGCRPIWDNCRQSLKSREQKRPVSQIDHSKKHEVLIGSIAVTIRNCGRHDSNNLDEAQVVWPPENHIFKKCDYLEKDNKPSFPLCGTNRSTVKYWRPVNLDGIKDRKVVGNGESQADSIANKAEDHTHSSESCLTSDVGSDYSRIINSCPPKQPLSEGASEDSVFIEISGGESQVDGIANESENHCQSSDNCKRSSIVDDDLNRMGSYCPITREGMPQPKFRFSSQVAKAFLSERWKEAISTAHVKLTLSGDFEPPGHIHLQNACQVACGEPLVVSIDTGNSIIGVRTQDTATSTTSTIKAKFKTKPDKGFKLKYIPKQRTIPNNNEG